MGDDAIAEKAPGPSYCAVNDLVRNHDCERGQRFFEAPDGADGDKVSYTKLLERIDVGLIW
jgi:hypothetical protein